MESCRCPITDEIFEDPVVGDDGHTYERKAITDWLIKNATSPITREPMNINSLRTNYTLKKMIEELRSREQSSQVQYQFQLDVDIRKTRHRPIFKSLGKSIYEVEWINRDGPPIILLKIDGAKAKREASFYVQLSCHPHIVRTFGLVQSNSDSVMLIQEAAPHGDLSEMLREHGFKPNETVLWEIFKQICDAMICLADNGIVHGDLACRNVLIFQSNFSESKKNLVKLTDFGLTRASTVYSVIASPMITTMTIIPVRYAAPEILQNPAQLNYSEKSDVYSMGVLMWEACSYGQMPYSTSEDDDVRQKKLNGERLPQPTLCSHQLWQIMNACWEEDPSTRPTFQILRELLIRLQTRHEFNQEKKSASFVQTEQLISNEDTAPDNATYIPCEFCDDPVDLSIWSTHVEACRKKEACRLEKCRQEIATNPITAQIPCEFCGELFPADHLETHQSNCPVNNVHGHSSVRQRQPFGIPENVVPSISTPKTKRSSTNNIASLLIDSNKDTQQQFISPYQLIERNNTVRSQKFQNLPQQNSIRRQTQLLSQPNDKTRFVSSGRFIEPQNTFKPIEPARRNNINGVSSFNNSPEQRNQFQTIQSPPWKNGNNTLSHSKYSTVPQNTVKRIEPLWRNNINRVSNFNNVLEQQNPFHTIQSRPWRNDHNTLPSPEYSTIPQNTFQPIEPPWSNNINTVSNLNNSPEEQNPSTNIYPSSLGCNDNTLPNFQNWIEQQNTSQTIEPPSNNNDDNTQSFESPIPTSIPKPNPL